MIRYLTHRSQRSLRTGIYSTKGARDEDIVTINEDDGTTQSGGEGEVTWPSIEISDDEDFESDWGLLGFDQTEEGETRTSPAIYLDSDVPTPRPSSITLPRNPPIETPFLSLDDFIHNDIRLHPRVFVELRDGDFMKIVHIVQDSRSSEVTIRGWIFRRTRKTNGVFNTKRNEVCWMVYIDDDDPRDYSIQGLETREVTEVVKRRQIRLTNQPFPALSYRDDRISESEETIEDSRVLVCRYKYLIFYPNAKARTSSHPWSEKLVSRLRADECDKRTDNNMKDEDIRTAWRGNTIPGGSQEGWLPGEKEFLRQEGVSNQGIKASQSLRGPSGLDYPAGDPMMRGSVGTLLGDHDLNSNRKNLSRHARSRSPLNFTSSSRPTANMAVRSMVTPKRAIIGSNNEDAVMVVLSHPDHDVDMASTPIQPRVYNKRKRPPAFTFDEDYDMSDQESCEDPAVILDLTKSLRETSIRPPSQRQRSSKIIKFNSEVKMWSNSGIETECTEGIITSSFTPTSGTSKGRRAVVPSPDSTRRCSKRKVVEVQGVLIDRLETKDDFVDLTRPNIESASSRKPNTPAPLQSIPRFATKLSPSTLVPSRSFPSNPRRRSPMRPFRFQRYTFGECFSGAGGMSRGAINAGLRIAWAFDFNLPACQTYQLNFLGTPIYNVWANDFSNSKIDFRVDICHISPPCQFFSPAHTSHGKDDDMNTASLFAIEALLKKAKPRIVTLEETAGLVRTRLHEIWFNAVINMFTSQGFSVRWKVVNCADFGVPQQRKRLLIIASCPGEVLPPFPAPTHSEYPARTGLKPWTTINQAIASIPTEWANHDVEGARKRTNQPYSGDRTANCITTGGNGAYHPSGKRSFTHREFACLQSFPLGHKFGSIGVKKQIGNAVPPTMATVLLEEVKKALMKADGL